MLPIFWALTPIPLLFAKGGDSYDAFDNGSNKGMDVAVFFVIGIVVSTCAFPLILARSPVEEPSISSTDAFFAELASLLIYTTSGLFLACANDYEAY